LTATDPTSQPEDRTSWKLAWPRLAQTIGLAPQSPVLVALSGGADSVYLLHLLACAEPRPKIVAVHVDHGLRGEEGREDAAFCARLAARLQIPFVCRTLELEADGPNLEARAREGRYAVLVEEARRAGIRVLLTGHHQDDALETLLMRWMRGTALAGLSGLRQGGTVMRGGSGSGSGMEVTVLRPLLSMRREEVRHLLRSAGLEWREDSSNESPRFTRNRVRNQLLPQVKEICGERGVDNLRAFARAVEGLEDQLATRTAHLAWSPPVHAAARRSSEEGHLGGTLSRAALSRLSPALQRRALWRLLTEGTGLAPARPLLQLLLDDLAEERCTRRSLPGDWTLQLRSRVIDLVPPPPRLRPTELSERSDGQLVLPFRPEQERVKQLGLLLSLDGSVELPDGRAICSELVRVDASHAVPRAAVEVELDATDLPPRLLVRTPRPGDRFHGLGAPGSRPLTRFLADAGIPREERSRVPLVFAGRELIWVAGIRPCESRRVRVGTEKRLRLRLLGAASEFGRAELDSPSPHEESLFAPRDGASGPTRPERRVQRVDVGVD
jgi:tRNA(Ile)-lysidine synthase